jgi:uncharacterized OB-fold protein
VYHLTYCCKEKQHPGKKMPVTHTGNTADRLRALAIRLYTSERQAAMQTQNSEPSHRPEAGALPTIGLLRCGACERLTYPASAYGCSYCGTPRESGTTFNAPARGVLRTWVTVYADFTPAVRAPYVVGDIELAPGIIEQVLVGVADESTLREGQILVGMEQPPENDAGGKPVKQYLRFVPENMAGGTK